MERLILDTTVLVSAERGSTSVLAEQMADGDDVAIAAITLAELLVGVQLASGKKKTARAAYVERIAQTFGIEDYTAAVASTHAGLLADAKRSGRPRGAHDLIIASTAIATARTLLTSDRQGFEATTGLSVRFV